MKNGGKTNVPAVTREAELAARAIARLEEVAQEVLNGDVPAMQLVADTGGITALIRDEHGTAVTIQRGHISVNVAAQDAEAAN